MSKARIISPNGHYHIISRGIQEIQLFRDDEDKTFFIKLLEWKSQKYEFTVYSFAIMDTHFHFSGIDNKGMISRMMQSILTTYAIHYNRKYKREGHVFMRRFTSIPLDSEMRIIDVSCYIHNNPKSIKGIAGIEYAFKYSSYSKYIGRETELNKFVDYTFVMELMFVKDVKEFNKIYFEYTKSKLKS